jgi:plastocyanin
MYNRRTVLKTVGSTGIALALAGCSSDGGDGGSDETTTTTTTTTESGGSDDEFVETDTVDMTDELKFVPRKIQVAVGTTVTWKNVGAIGHTVTAYEDEIPEDADYFASGGFETEAAARDGYPESGNITEGQTYEHTFETPGVYEYMCIPHEMSGMVGTVKVV